MADDMEALSAALDSWAEVANISAADVEELATASQKAASTANTVGVSMDQLAAQIATIESVTKDAPENIGKKIFYCRLYPFHFVSGVLFY
jgi:TP901 family phage tail tape measure protein